MQRSTQKLSEALLPLLGFYFWGWDWYFILLFYILDGAAKETILHLKSKKIIETQGGKASIAFWKRSAIQSIALGLGLIGLLQFLQIQRQPDFSFTLEFLQFWNHKEMGVAQGWILLPLICLTVWMQYTYSFLKLKEHTKMKVADLWNEHLNLRKITLALVATALGLSYFITISDAVLLWVSVVYPTAYLVLFDTLQRKSK